MRETGRHAEEEDAEDSGPEAEAIDDAIITQVQESYVENAAYISADAGEKVNAIIEDAEEYLEFQPKEWTLLLRRLEQIIDDYKSGFGQEADNDLDQLVMDTDQLKKSITVH